MGAARENAMSAESFRDDPLREPAWVRVVLIALAVLAMVLLVVLPLLTVLASAFGDGFGAWWAALREPDALAALRLTLLTVAIAVPVNAVCGVLMAWALARFEFAGKRVLLALIDLPFAVSPVVAGLCLVLLFGAHGWFAELLAEHDIRILFARPGIVLATLFITFPFVVRELLPLHIEILYNEFDTAAAFAAASLLSGMALVTLVLKFWLESRYGDALASSHRKH
jgi:sulfate transport system permease protein